MDDRALNISKSHIIRAAQDKNYLEALAFTIMIKAQHVNSMLLNTSQKEIMRLCKCSGNTAKTLKNAALNAGLVEQTKTLYTHLVAPQLSREKDKERVEQFWIHKCETGVCLYIKSNTHNKKKYEAQTISDVKNLILADAILIGIGKHNNSLNTWLRNVNRSNSDGIWMQGKYVLPKRNGEPTLDWRNRGYGRKKMLDVFFDKEIGMHKLRTLIGFLKKEKLIKSRKNIVPLEKFDQDHCFVDLDDPWNFGFDAETRKRFRIKNFFDDYKNKKFNPAANIRLNRDVTSAKKGELMRCAKFADSYEITAGHSRWTKNWKARNKKQKQKREVTALIMTITVSLFF